ncbi:MAG: protein translocase subunit SecF [Oscillospiraceae bacterium]
MRKVKKKTFFIAIFLIAIFTYLTFYGIHSHYGDTTKTYIKSTDDIRWGIDIQGGVTATYEPVADNIDDVTDDDMDAAKNVIQQRLLNLNIVDSDVYVDYKQKRVVVSFPWQAGETDFDPEAAVAELGNTYKLIFRYGETADGKQILTGDQVAKAKAIQQQNKTTGNLEWVVSLALNDEATTAFAAATTELASSDGYISIWMDDDRISYASVDDPITGGEATISGNFSYASAEELANQINAGQLTYPLNATSTNTITPTLGSGAKSSMLLAGVIAFFCVAAYVSFIYRLPGIIAALALIGQVAGSVAAISGFFGSLPSFTLTIPGIAGIILSIGMGVDANVITTERIKEELRAGKTLNGAIELGYKRAWSAVFDGNITVIIVAVILMGAFGPTDGLFAVLLKWVFFPFGASTAGTIYSLGYTLLIGIFLNFIFGVFFSRIMLASISRFKPFRKIGMYCKMDYTPPKTFNIVGNKKKFFAFSLSLLALIIIGTAAGKLNVAIEFKGGTMISYTYDGDIDTDKVEDAIKTAIGEDATVTKGESITTGSDLKNINLSFSSKDGLTGTTQQKLKESLIAAFPDNNLKTLSSTDVSPQNGKEFFLKSLVAVGFAGLMTIIYIGFRFRKIGGFSAGVTSIIALLHDIVLVYGTFLVCGYDINANLIAVLLTVLGYSINSTIIIYDRIRENRKIMGRKATVTELVDVSVTQTLGRSINTTVATVLAMAIVCVVCLVTGVSTIMSFAFPLIVGMITGVYSSNCIATSLWVLWQNHTAKKLAAKR